MCTRLWERQSQDDKAERHPEHKYKVRTNEHFDSVKQTNHSASMTGPLWERSTPRSQRWERRTHKIIWQVVMMFLAKFRVKLQMVKTCSTNSEGLDRTSDNQASPSLPLIKHMWVLTIYSLIVMHHYSSVLYDFIQEQLKDICISVRCY